MSLYPSVTKGKKIIEEEEEEETRADNMKKVQTVQYSSPENESLVVA
jgi:hypothetical protein